MSTTTERPDELIEILEGDLLSRNDKINRWGNIISSFQDIPGLVGFWPMSSVQRSTGNAFDLTGQGRTLTYNGNPTYNIYNDFIPYIDLDGTGDFLSRADETDLDILGTETIYNSSVRGLTLGGWFLFDDATPASSEALLSKTDLVNQRSYEIRRRASGVIAGIISNDGTVVITVEGTTVDTANIWNFIVISFKPSTSISAVVNGNKTVQTTAVPASIFNSTSSFEVGRFANGTGLLDGRASLCFLSANALSDALINGLFQQSRILFGV